MTYHSTKTIERFLGLCDWLIQTYEFRKFLFDENPDLGVLQAPRHEHFFYRLHVVLQESWMQQLARLHDPAVQSGGINLTIEYIVEYGGWDDEFKTKLQNCKREMDILYPAIKVARNKILSHNDLKTMVNTDEALGQFEKGQDVQYFESLKEFCELLAQAVLGKPFLYDDLVKNDVDAFMAQFMRGQI
jgi:hypothetical protein